MDEQIVLLNDLPSYKLFKDEIEQLNSKKELKRKEK